MRRRAAAAQAKKAQDTTTPTNTRPDPNDRLLATKESRDASRQFQAKLQAVPQQQHRDLIFKPKKSDKKIVPSSKPPTKILTTSGKKLGMGVGIPPEALSAYEEAQRKVAAGEWVAATAEEEALKRDEDYIDDDDPLDSPERLEPPDLTHVPDHQLNFQQRKNRARNRKKREKRKAKEAAEKESKQGAVSSIVSTICGIKSPLTKYAQAKVDSSPENSPHGTPDRAQGNDDLTSDAYQQNTNVAESVLEDPNKKTAILSQYSEGEADGQDFQQAGEH